MLGKIIFPAWFWMLALSDQYAYVADGEYGLRIIDISNPRALLKQDFFDPGIASDVTIAGDFAYVLMVREGSGS